MFRDCIRQIKDFFQYDEIPWHNRFHLFDLKVWYEFVRLKAIEFLKITPYLIAIILWITLALIINKYGSSIDAVYELWGVCFAIPPAIMFLTGVLCAIVATIFKKMWQFISRNWWHAVRNAQYRKRHVVFDDGTKIKIVDCLSSTKFKLKGGAVLTNPDAYTYTEGCKTKNCKII